VATVAGSGRCGFAGEGGAAIEADLLRPQDVAVDRDGDLYFTDVRTFTVRKIDPGGTITTVAGFGVSRPVDIGGFDPTGGLLCSLHTLPLPQPSYLGDGWPATEAGLYFPHAIAIGVDGDLYIGDTFDHRIRRVACGGSVPCVGPAFAHTAAGPAPATGEASRGPAAPVIELAAMVTAAVVIVVLQRAVYGGTYGRASNRKG
jgi:hypothetical protein